MSEIETTLRADAARDATAFDAALHARVMRHVGDLPGAAPTMTTRRPWRLAGALAASIAAGAWLAWPKPQAAMPAIPWEPDRSIARLYASPVESPSAGVALAGDFSRLIRAQFDLATSCRPARRAASPT